MAFTPEQIKMFADGTIKTLELTFVSMFLGVLLALVIAFMSISENKLAKGFAWLYNWIFRGTPLLLQILTIYMGLPLLIKGLTGSPYNFEKFTAAAIALTLNTAAYTAEIIRAGIQSIDKGQMEAGKALGMTYMQTMFKVIIPQTIARIIPPFSNEFIMILKDTSLVSTIGMVELMRVTNTFTAQGDVRPYFLAALIYLALTSISILIFQQVEKKASAYL